MSEVLTPPPSERGPERPQVPIVGIGASAGGLEALSLLLAALPAATGLAFVVIQHLDASHESLLATALSQTTAMTVVQAREGTQVEADHVYVIPPDTTLALQNDRLSLLPREHDTGRPPLPIDLFLRSLAAERRGQAIGVILSGMGNDGTDGLLAVKDAGGLTFAQEPQTARFRGMPESAIAKGAVDFTLPPAEIAAELLRLRCHPYLDGRGALPAQGQDGAALQRLFALLRSGSGIDFAEYKLTTVLRRLARRTALRRIDDLESYLVLLAEDPTEVKALAEDILVHVTSFFRDPAAFTALKERVFPEILKHKKDSAPIRVWVSGCATGEEAYSVAMLLAEFLAEAAPRVPFQIFGSDLSATAIERARAATYGDTIARDVSPERLARFFTPIEGGGYRVHKSLRESCVFVRHDLAADPPFSRLDLITCRNVLIYFAPALQRRILPVFHYCLRTPGFLLLGHTESLGTFPQLFTPVDKAQKIFARTALSSALSFSLSLAELGRGGRRAPARQPEGGPLLTDVRRQADQLLLARFSPPGVLINDRLEIVQFRGHTGRFLSPAPGEPQSSLLKMVREGLVAELQLAIERVRKEGITVRQLGARLWEDGQARTVNLEVIPISGLPESSERYALVLFEEVEASTAATSERPAPPREREGGSENARLREELQASKEYLRTLLDEHQRIAEALTATNEELLSSNEELQSTNEELETAKEELQSANEELNTVNEELHHRNQELSQLNNDLVNLIGSVDIPIIIVGGDGKIRRFTPLARSIMNLIPSDVGRPFGDMRPNLLVPDLESWVAEVMETLIIKEAEVVDREGRWYRIQIRPYRTTDNRIDGVVLSLTDINTLKHTVSDAEAARDAAASARAEAERADRAKDLFLAMLSHELRTPLTSMLLSTQVIRRGKAKPEALDRAVLVIERGIAVQTRLIDDLLDVSRIVSGKLALARQQASLLAIVQAAVGTVREQAVTRAIKLEVLLDLEVGMVYGDPVRLQQVLWNLLTNAIKFTPPDGVVTLRMERRGAMAWIQISDTGKGIKPEFLAHLFDPFSQEDSAPTRAFGGLGLGLAIVRHLVEQHAGAVVARSPGEGLGATFTVTLPLLPLAEPAPAEPAGGASAAPADAADAESQSALRGVRVLLIEDDHDTREALGGLLCGLSAEVQGAASVSEGLRLLCAAPPTVILCDLSMPVEDGYDFLRQQRQLAPALAAIPSVAVTAHAGEADRQRALRSGFWDCLQKPVDLTRLTALIIALHTGAAPLAPSAETPAEVAERVKAASR